MAQYIERAKVTDALIDNTSIVGDELEEAVNAICAIPAADVRPVVRATWEEYGDGEQKFYSCSNCFATHYRWDNFCPNCGADMREES